MDEWMLGALRWRVDLLCMALWYWYEFNNEDFGANNVFVQARKGVWKFWYDSLASSHGSWWFARFNVFLHALRSAVGVLNLVQRNTHQMNTLSWTIWTPHFQIYIIYKLLLSVCCSRRFGEIFVGQTSLDKCSTSPHPFDMWLYLGAWSLPNP